MIDILNWVTQDKNHFVGTWVALMLFGAWIIAVIKAWKGTE